MVQSLVIPCLSGAPNHNAAARLHLVFKFVKVLPHLSSCPVTTITNFCSVHTPQDSSAGLQEGEVKVLAQSSKTRSCQLLVLCFQRSKSEI